MSKSSTDVANLFYAYTKTRDKVDGKSRLTNSFVLQSTRMKRFENTK